MPSFQIETDLRQYLPYWFREIAEFDAILTAEEGQWDALSEAISLVHDNFFFQTMDAPTVTAWERLIGILASPSTEGLDFRRARLINRLSTRPPFTLQFLYDKLDELIGPGKWSCEIDYPNYAIIIGASAQDVNWQGEILVTLGTIKPAHMVFTTRPEVWNVLLLDESVGLVKRVYHYYLGAWGLGLDPFADTNQTFYYHLGEWSLGEKPFGDEEQLEVIVTPDQNTIHQNLLDQTAGFVAEDVAAARINGTVVISDLAKSSSGSQAEILYSVSQEQAATITQLELLDSEGNTLTSAPVYVPVLGYAAFKHTITAKEGNS